jgi:Fic family protein
MTFQPDYLITDTIAHSLERIAEVKAIIENAPILPAFETRLRNEAKIRSVHASIRLEGNRLEENQVKQVLEGKKVQAWKRDILEAKNYSKALDYIGSIYQQKNLKITEEVILKLHAMLLEKVSPKEAGRYRKIPVVVKNVRTQEIVFRPPDSHQVASLMREFASWLESNPKISPVIESGIAHYELVRIHPFVDGNGRSARLLAVLVLYQRGYDIRRIFSIENYADEHPEEYYKAIKESDRHQGVTPFLEFWAAALANELTKLKEKILTVSLDKRLREKAGQTFLNPRQWEALRYLHQNPFMSRADFQKIAQTPERTARRDLEELVKVKVLTRQGKGKALRYLLPTA